MTAERATSVPRSRRPFTVGLVAGLGFFVAPAAMTHAELAPVQALQVPPGSAPSRPAPRPIRLGARAQVMVPVVTVGGQARGLGGFGVMLTAPLSGSFVDFIGDFAGGDGKRMLGAGVGFFSLLGSGDRAPYLGGSALWIVQHLGGRGASGAQVRPTLGLAWNRGENVQGRAEVSYFIDLFEERTVDRLIAGNDRTYRSHGPMISLGASF
jgi:hypothetical protein